MKFDPLATSHINTSSHPSTFSLMSGKRGRPPKNKIDARSSAFFDSPAPVGRGKESAASTTTTVAAASKKRKTESPVEEPVVAKRGRPSLGSKEEKKAKPAAKTSSKASKSADETLPQAPDYPHLDVDISSASGKQLRESIQASLKSSSALPPDQRLDALFTLLVSAEIERLKDVYGQSDEPFSFLLDAFAAGVNTFTTSLRKHHFMFPSKHLRQFAMASEHDSKLAQLQRRENVLTEALQRVAAETEAWTTIEKKWESEREPEQISKHADTVLAQWKDTTELPPSLPAADKALLEGAAISKVDRAAAQLYDNFATKTSRLAQLLQSTTEAVENAKRLHAAVVPRLAEKSMQPYAAHADINPKELTGASSSTAPKQLIRNMIAFGPTEH